MMKLFNRASIELFLLRQKARDLLANKDGVTMIEYSILLAIITALVITIIVAMGGKVLQAWTDVNNAWT